MRHNHHHIENLIATDRANHGHASLSSPLVSLVVSSRGIDSGPVRMSFQSALQFVSRAGIGIAGLGFISSSCLYNVGPGHRAVIFDKTRNGCRPETSGEGTGFIIPFIQVANIIDCRVRPSVIESQTGTKDVQQVSIALRVLSHPDEAGLTKIYQKYGNRSKFDEKVLPSIGNEVLKSVVAQYNAEELLSKREQISQQIREKLKLRAKVAEL